MTVPAPDRPFVMVLGEAYLKEGDSAAALSAFRTGFNINPQLFPFAERSQSSCWFSLSMMRLRAM